MVCYDYTGIGMFRTILILFLVFRLTLLVFFTPQGLVNAYTDYYYYYQTAQLSQQGYYPFINMWYEYPPLLAYLPQAAYWFAGRIVPLGDIYSFGYVLFFRVLGVFLLAFEAGVLVLLHRIGGRIWGPEKADWLAWVYSSLSLPLFFLTFAHQVVAVFFLLLAVDWLLEQHWGRSALALGLGVAAKFTPAFLLPAVARFLWPHIRKLAGYTLIVILIVALVYLPFVFLGGGKWVMASFEAVSKVGSYGTIWAALDQNWGPGTYGPLETRMQIEQAQVTHANPALIPGALLLAAFAALYAWFFFRPLDFQDARQVIWFITFTSMIFHLWSRGWSPQWAVMVVPLFLLSFPNNEGLRYVLLLTALIFVEWPVTTIAPAPVLVTTFILLRTALFIWVTLRLARLLWPAGAAPAV